MKQPPRRQYIITPRCRKPGHMQLCEEYVVKLLASGFTLKEAEALIGLSRGTGKQYLSRAREATGTKTTAQLIARWARGKLA